MTYNETKRELRAEAENEYIIDVNDEDGLYVFKKVRLGKYDTPDHYDAIIIDDLNAYLEQKQKEYDEKHKDDEY